VLQLHFGNTRQVLLQPVRQVLHLPQHLLQSADSRKILLPGSRNKKWFPELLLTVSVLLNFRYRR
jgi:hypothetical protein